VEWRRGGEGEEEGDGVGEATLEEEGDGAEARARGGRRRRGRHAEGNFGLRRGGEFWLSAQLPVAQPQAVHQG
jgi:hypothetical protein